jgi:hypothetical protein
MNVTAGAVMDVTSKWCSLAKGEEKSERAHSGLCFKCACTRRLAMTEDETRVRVLVRKLVEQYEAACLAKVVMNRALTKNPYSGMEVELSQLRGGLSGAVHAEYQALYAALDNPESNWLDVLQAHLDKRPAVRGM